MKKCKNISLLNKMEENSKCACVWGTDNMDFCTRICKVCDYLSIEVYQISGWWGGV